MKVQKHKKDGSIEDVQVDEQSLLRRAREVMLMVGKRTKLESLNEKHTDWSNIVFNKKSGGMVVYKIAGEYGERFLKAIISQKNKRRGFNWMVNGQATTNAKNLYLRSSGNEQISFEPLNHIQE